MHSFDSITHLVLTVCDILHDQIGLNSGQNNNALSQRQIYSDSTSDAAIRSFQRNHNGHNYAYLSSSLSIHIFI